MFEFPNETKFMINVEDYPINIFSLTSLVPIGPVICEKWIEMIKANGSRRRPQSADNTS
jgi:hypothetical protein